MKKVKLNLGAGLDKLNGFKNLDKKDFDLNKFPYPIKTSSVDEVYMKYVLEHLDDPIRVLKELYRICKNEAEIKLILPFGVRGLCNIQHRTFWNNYSLDFVERNNKRHYYLDKEEFVILAKYTKPYWWASWLPFRDKIAVLTSFLINQSITWELMVIKGEKNKPL